jgi:acyl-coenzyme A thioesterase PaaI-like protein
LNSAEELRALLASHQQPVCADLTPFQVLEADLTSGHVRLRFDEQPAFRNHFGCIQGGFGVAMLDVCISIAAFARLRLWLPTIEIKCSFLAPLPVGTCTGEGRVLRAGRSVVFLEGTLWGSGDQPALHATATALIPAG